MKYFQTLILLIFSLFIISCSEDDDGSTDPNVLTNENLAGTYNVTAFNAIATESDTSGSSPDIITSDIVGSDFDNVTFTFTEAGIITTAGTFTVTATISEDGTVYTETYPNPIDLTGTYSISGTSLILSNNDGANVTIQNFSSNGLQLFFEQTEVEPNYRYEAEGTYTLVRQ
jgi:PKD repeat protein